MKVQILDISKQRQQALLRAGSSGAVYPLGFDDPSGIQSQQSLTLMPAFSLISSGSFSIDVLDPELQRVPILATDVPRRTDHAKLLFGN